MSSLLSTTLVVGKRAFVLDHKGQVSLRSTVYLILSGIKVTAFVDTDASCTLLRREIVDLIVRRMHRACLLEHSGPLQGLGGVNTGLGGVNTGLGGVNTGLGGVNTGLGGVNTGLGGVNTGLGGVNTGLGGVNTGCYCNVLDYIILIWTIIHTTDWGRLTYHIVLDPNVQPTIHAPRKCPIQMKDEIKSELEKMECLDPKDLNRAIKRCHHKTPTLEEITHQFTRSKFFSKLDAKNGYWSVTLDNESSLLTTFNSPFGRYYFLRMPFGLVMAQDVFQQKLDAILESCPGTLGIADNVAVFGRSEAEHDANLHNLMPVSCEHGLVFNSKKCAIKAPQISFFGTIYDVRGVHPDPKKVEDIQMIPTPESKTELQEFLGIVTYMGSFEHGDTERTPEKRCRFSVVPNASESF